MHRWQALHQCHVRSHYYYLMFVFLFLCFSILYFFRGKSNNKNENNKSKWNIRLRNCMKCNKNAINVMFDDFFFRVSRGLFVRHEPDDSLFSEPFSRDLQQLKKQTSSRLLCGVVRRTASSSVRGKSNLKWKIYVTAWCLTDPTERDRERQRKTSQIIPAS